MKITQEQKDILSIIMQNGPLSKKDLAKAYHISIPKATVLIGALDQLGYIQYIDGTSTGGRIPQLVKVRDNITYSVGIDIGTEYLRIGIVDIEGRIVARYQEIHDIEVQRELSIESLYEHFKDLCREAAILPSSVEGIGVGITGIIHEEKGVCLSLRNTPHWKGFNVKKAMQKIFNREKVILVDSVKAMALAEKRFGTAKELQDFVLINIGIGLGAGIVINGQLLTGSRGTTGEIGHMQIRPSQDLCVCGNYGCLEATASGWALLKKCKKALQEGVETSMGDANSAHALTVQDIIEAANGGDKIALVMMESIAKDLSVGIGAVINLLNPEKVFLAGGLIRHAGAIMLDPIRRGVKSSVIPWLQQNIDLQLSTIGEWDAVIGAATLATDSVIREL
jgi:predicted NBD/HSP70 family sugar kinase